MTLLEDLQYYQSRRRFPNWEPKPSQSTCKLLGTPEESVLYRCLDFLPLELQVATWDYRISKLLTEYPEIQTILTRNAKDEDKHDQVLRYLMDYVGKDATKIPQEAQDIIGRWEALDTIPVISMYALEMGVFFSILPTLIKFGDVYAATVSQWIADDERVHVETGLRLIKHFGLKLPKEVLQLVYDTNEYIFKPLGSTYADSQAKRALKRLVSGKDALMLQESIPITIAFFEQSDNRAIVY